MKSHNVLLLHDFNAPFSSTALKALQEGFPEALNMSIKNEIDFNRWDSSLRVNKKFIAFVNENQSLSKHFKVIRVSDMYAGHIVFDEESKEEFWQLPGSEKQ